MQFYGNTLQKYLCSSVDNYFLFPHQILDPQKQLKNFGCAKRSPTTPKLKYEINLLLPQLQSRALRSPSPKN
jgi:hypothetical protein